MKRTKKAKKNVTRRAKEHKSVKHKVAAVPPHLGTVTPHVVVKGGAEALSFYKKAFGAKELFRSAGADGNLMHAEVKIGDSVVFVADEFPGAPIKSPKSLGGTTVALNIYAKDCDALYNQAVSAGAKPIMPPADMFWGDRYSQVEDLFGHTWAIATHKEDLKPAEVARRAQEFFAKSQGAQHS